VEQRRDEWGTHRFAYRYIHNPHKRAGDNGQMKRRIISHYEFVRRIGAGGSGVVFLATDTLLQRPVVLKLLKRGALTLEQVRTTQLRSIIPMSAPSMTWARRHPKMAKKLKPTS
jgi:serine/threonine protein kinase